MPFTSDSGTIGRIINAIKTYRHLTQDHCNPLDSDAVTIHLKRHLSLADWLVWQRACGGQRVRLLADGMGYA